ncbi:hypothetical protein VP501E541_P0202 [Vibrio phage 501E54-1]|nr:hypothetical protein VP501E541_P0202 [Vibrio phage 501E54-1]
MSWQADMTKLHDRAKGLGIDLEEFEEEFLVDDHWYTEDNIQTLVDCILDEVANLKSGGVTICV